jgi:hypothetical protein
LLVVVGVVWLAEVRVDIEHLLELPVLTHLLSLL